MSTEHTMQELKWLERQSQPMWGAHLEQGKPCGDPQITQWVTLGLIEAVDQPKKGYVLTDKGRKFVASGDKILSCPFCGRLPTILGSGEGQRGLMIHCITPWCVNPSVSHYDHDAAKRAWNRRVRG